MRLSVSWAETEQRGLGVWKSCSEAWRPALLRSSHHSSLTCPVYSPPVSAWSEVCVRVCICVCRMAEIWVAKAQASTLQECANVISVSHLTQHYNCRQMTCAIVSKGWVRYWWMIRTSLDVLWWGKVFPFFSGLGVYLWACGGCWRMFGPQFWWRLDRRFLPQLCSTSL